MSLNASAKVACARLHVLRRPVGRFATALLASCLLLGCSDGHGPAMDAGPTPGNEDTTPPPTGSASMGKVTLRWAPPTTNEDGSPLTDLAGYHVYYGRAPGAWAHTLDLPAGAAGIEIRNLAAGSWYFSISSYNTAGVESARSGVVSATI